MKKKIILLIPFMFLFFILMSACNEDEIVPPTLNSPEHDEALFGFWESEDDVLEVGSEGDFIWHDTLYDWETDSIFLYLTEPDSDEVSIFQYEIDDVGLWLQPFPFTFRVNYIRPTFEDTLRINSEADTLTVGIPETYIITIDLIQPCKQIQRIAEGEYPPGQHQIPWIPLATIENGDYALKSCRYDDNGGMLWSLYYFKTIIREK